MNYFDIPFRFTDQTEEPGLIDEEARHLGYRVLPAPVRQPVVRDRLCLQPDLDLNDYKCQATLDWIEFSFETHGEHQAINLKRKIDTFCAIAGSPVALFISGPTRKERYYGSHFVLRLQDPTPALLARVIEATRASCWVVEKEPYDDFEITGIEVAVDFYPKSRSDITEAALVLKRWRMSEVLRMHIHPAPVFMSANKDCPRAFFSQCGARRNKLIVNRNRQLPKSLLNRIDGTGITPDEVASANLTSHFKPPLDATYYIGKANNEAHLRLQDKTANKRNGGKMVALPARERRSRIEICLLRPDLDLVGGPAAARVGTPRELSRFKFQDLRKAAFDFGIPTITAHPGALQTQERRVFERSGSFGLDQFHRAQQKLEEADWVKGKANKPKALGIKGHRMAYADLNAMVERALRRLNTSWEPVGALCSVS